VSALPPKAEFVIATAPSALHQKRTNCTAAIVLYLITWSAR
jgi:hypothetical protein